MNKQETKAIDEATAKAEAELIIEEARRGGGVQFLSYVFGWMMNDHTNEIARAAESWIETDNWTPEKEN